MNKLKPALTTVFLSTFGMALGYGLITQAGRFIPAAHAASSVADTITTRSLELVDDRGQRRILMTMAQQGAPSIWFFDERGNSRLNIFLYEDGNPGIVLNDPNQQAAQILRTVGTRGAPVLVMKSGGRDRLIMGMQNSDEPSLVVMDAQGSRKTVVGK